MVRYMYRPEAACSPSEPAAVPLDRGLVPCSWPPIRVHSVELLQPSYCVSIYGTGTSRSPGERSEESCEREERYRAGKAGSLERSGSLFVFEGNVVWLGALFLSLLLLPPSISPSNPGGDGCFRSLGPGFIPPKSKGSRPIHDLIDLLRCLRSVVFEIASSRLRPVCCLLLPNLLNMDLPLRLARNGISKLHEMQIGVIIGGVTLCGCTHFHGYPAHTPTLVAHNTVIPQHERKEWVKHAAVYACVLD